ncbi:MAG TPA: DUF503 domain-containing protein [Anaerolineae bacterium]|nr:DUF503 domain-containing protein [Anaerolineae bacterium]HOQ99781.1 DUF503 domain-containing protein [Anaerolineae bacterium]
MVVGVCTIQLDLPASESLKDKRSVIKSVIARVHNEFNVSIAEVGDNDRWRSAVLGVAAVSNEPAYAEGLLARVVQWIDETRLDVTLIDYEIELL